MSTMHKSLPFEIGQLAEAKSFTTGYRSAWFRCKIQGITRRKGQIVYALEYYDYPDERVFQNGQSCPLCEHVLHDDLLKETEWIEIYQKPPSSGRSASEVKKELMLRPRFPPIYNVNELPDVNSISEVIVVVDGVWRVGDFVDWLSEGCFWSGTITEIMDNDLVKVKFPEPPVGEGSLDCVSCKDLRPSLDWSPESGWTVPTPPGSQSGHLCARLILPLKQEGDTQNDKKATQGCSLELDESSSSQTSANSFPHISRSNHPEDLLIRNDDFSMKEMQQTQSADIAVNIGDSDIEKPRADDSLSSTYVRDVLGEVPGVISAEEQYHDDEFSKKMPVNETISINSSSCDSIEGTVVDLEEVVNRVKWLRQILKFGISSSFLGPTWKFLEHSAVSKPK